MWMVRVLCLRETKPDEMRHKANVECYNELVFDWTHCCVLRVGREGEREQEEEEEEERRTCSQFPDVFKCAVVAHRAHLSLSLSFILIVRSSCAQQPFPSFHVTLENHTACLTCACLMTF